jgi:Skp family chaperone for outer membrane proteins
MRRRFIAVLSIAVCPFVLISAGCGTGCFSSNNGGGGASENRPSGIAVVDLDEVARQLGKDVALLKQINDGQSSLNQQLQALQSSLQEKFQRKSREIQLQPIGNGMTAEAQKQQLAGLERELNLQLNQAKRSAESNLSAYRQQLIQRFRAEVIPAAKAAAAERGLGVVVTKNDMVLLAFDEAHDITSAVIARLRAKSASWSDAESASSANDSGAQPARR